MSYTTNWKAERKELATLFAQLRNEGRALPAALVEMHQRLCEDLRNASEEADRKDAQLAALERWALAPTAEQLGDFELHLSPGTPLSATLRKKINALGGHYSECRGDAGLRFVKLPNLKGGRALALQCLQLDAQYKRELFGEDRKTTVVVRGRFARSNDRVCDRKNWTEADLLRELKVVNDAALPRAIAQAQRDAVEARMGL